MKKIAMIAKIRKVLSNLDPGMLSFLLLVLILTIVWMGVNLPMGSASAQSTPPPTPVEPTLAPAEPQHTPIPVEYLSNNTQTDGIVFGSILLVLIVVGGTLSVMWRRDRNRPAK